MGLDLRSLVHRTEKSAENGHRLPESTDETTHAAPDLAVNVPSVLQQARAGQGITLDQAAAETRISREYLEEFEGRMEANRLPPFPYRRYFLREYARFLGVAEDSVVEPAPPPQDESPLVPDLKPLMWPKRRRWPVRALVLASVLGLIALGVVRAVGRSGPSVPLVPPAAAGSSSGATPSVAGQAGSRSLSGAARGIRAVVAVSVPSWVEAVADGKVVWQGSIPAGRSVKVSAKTSLQLVLGNAGGVRLLVNGKRVPTGAFGQVMRLSFAWKNGRLIAASAVR